MKIKVEQIKEPLEIEVKGDEGWLSKIYQGFGFRDRPDPAQVKAKIEISRESSDICQIKGTLSFAPLVECSRCADPIPWDASHDFHYRIYPESMINNSNSQTSDHAQALAEVIAYQHGEIDVEQILNDQIQLKIPHQTILRSEDQKSCVICNTPLDQPLVYEDEKKEDASENPFSALGKLLQ